MINYNSPAELYPGRQHGSARGSRYQRFPSLAEAIQYAVEELPVRLQASSLIEVDEVRYGGDQIRSLYFSEDYPLRRAFVDGGQALRGKTA
ncbi:hypothetical protein JI749_04790 [Devosia oryziradicis]|uniref:Transposase n=1 Tax=Devosia oryziradicis TaxID=2801335 RepID=A0ABX7BZK0_9HYPH|nr:hypothetical protein [Devosia oryziradicis]QQR36947.1 hypothetical protein JI749_04790 [Devosia oryziradicis]